MTDGVFMTDSRMHYQLSELTDREASDFGCPGATHIVTGSNGHIVGTAVHVTGKRVKVPGWPTRRGYRSIFTPWGSPETGTAFRGWMGE